MDSLYDIHQTSDFDVFKEEKIISIPFDNPFKFVDRPREDIISINKKDSCGALRLFLTLDNTIDPTYPAYCVQYKCFGLSDCGGPDHPCPYGKTEYAMGLGELKNVAGDPFHIGKTSYTDNKLLFYSNKNGKCGTETLNPLNVNKLFTPTPLISVSPNPFNHSTTLKFGKLKISKISILDLNGRVIKSYTNIGTNSFVISASDLEQGFYLINAIGENGSTSKFLKIQVIK